MIRWGILGAGNIAHRFAASVKKVSGSRLEAISCRTKEKAEAFDAGYPIEKRYASHEELLADPEIDAVYLAVPHGLHCEWACRALQAGKAVLCEKPAVLHADEMRKIAEISGKEGVLFMEAMKTRFVPAYQALLDVLEKGEIGEVTGVSASICNEMPFDKWGMVGKTYHTDPTQGGALWDCGIYGVSWIEAFCQGTPKVMGEKAVLKEGIDYYVNASLAFDETTAELEAAFDRKKAPVAILYGTKGSIRIEEMHRSRGFTVYPDDKEPYQVDVPYKVDDFYGQICHFAECMQEGRKESPIMPLEASIRCAEIIDAVRERFFYGEECLDALAGQEEILQYEKPFGSREALSLGTRAANLVYEGNYDREVSIQITRECDQTVLFRYVMDSKSERNILFMEGKRKTALKSGHASIWDYVESKVKGSPLAPMGPDYMPVGGAFPIRVKGEWVATLAISGLHEGEDHELCVKALENELQKEAPAFPGILV